MRSIAAFAVAVLVAAHAAAADTPAVPSKTAVSDASLIVVDAAAKTEVQTVSDSQQVCPRCGKVHRRSVAATHRSNAGFFDRVMDLERRKNKWLLSLIRR